jgi:hypothetical protein
MQYSHSPQPTRRGITVLTLLLLIITVIVGAIVVIRYLRSRPQASVAQPTQGMALLHQSFNKLNLSGMIEIVGRDSVNFLGVGPYSAG